MDFNPVRILRNANKQIKKKALTPKHLHHQKYCCEKVKSCIYHLVEDKLMWLFSKTKNVKIAAPYIIYPHVVGFATQICRMIFLRY